MFKNEIETVKNGGRTLKISQIGLGPQGLGVMLGASAQVKR
jgi:hypothetical protein